MCSNKNLKLSDTDDIHEKSLDTCNMSEILDLNQNHDDKKQRFSSPCHLSSHSSSASSVSPVIEVSSGSSALEQTLVPNLNQHTIETLNRNAPAFFPLTTGNANGFTTPMDQYRLQFYNYAMMERMRNQANTNLQQLYQPFNTCGSRLAFSLFQNRAFQPEEPKPQHSYIGLIAMAILSTPDQKLVLSDIYQHILDNYPYFRTRGPGWRNSIRHNLSLNDCFIKAGRSANGKGHYWAIHPANIEDFKKGDFRRRKAQRKVRKHMGLAVDEDADSPSPPPLSLSPPHPLFPAQSYGFAFDTEAHWNSTKILQNVYTHSSRKRQFDVASLLAPDSEEYLKNSLIVNKRVHISQEQDDEDIDVVANDDLTPSAENVPSSAETIKQLDPNDAYLNHKPLWSNLTYHLPFSISNLDPRLLNCYHATGQYQSTINKRAVFLNEASQPAVSSAAEKSKGCQKNLEKKIVEDL